MKKFIALLLALLTLLALVACDTAKDEKKENDEKTTTAQGNESGKKTGTEWPTNTIFPRPEGCKIIEVKTEDWKNYVTVEWDSKEAAKNYIEVVKAAEGESAEVIGQGETDEYVYYGTYNVTITSMNEAENIVLYK